MKKFYYLFWTAFIKIFIIIIPIKSVRAKLRVIKNNLIAYTYNFMSVDDYARKKNIKLEQFPLGNNKVSLLNNFYVNVYEDLSYLHDGDNNILEECASSKNPKILAKKSIHIKPDKVKMLDKAVVFALETEHNYWHFTFHCLDKVINLEESGFDGKYLIFDDNYIKELMKLIGISDERVIPVYRNDVYKVSKLYVIDDYFKTDYSALQKVKEKILSNIDLSDIEKYPKRLFVRRIEPYKRILKNESEVIELLSEYGFDVIFPDDYSVEEQIKYFYAAEIVVAPHGANSTNALYMRENTRFIECFSNYYITPCMLDVIRDNKMSYNMLVSYTNIEGKITDIIGRNEDYLVNLNLLKDTIYNL